MFSSFLSTDIEVACYGYEGIDAVKEALRAGLGCSTEAMPIKVILLLTYSQLMPRCLCELIQLFIHETVVLLVATLAQLRLNLLTNCRLQLDFSSSNNRYSKLTPFLVLDRST